MKKDTFKNLLILILLLIIAGGGVFLYKHSRPHAEEAVKSENLITVAAEQPKVQDIVVSKSFIGRVAAVRSVNILPYLSGYIAQIPADSGQEVKKGDILIVLRQEEYKAALTSAYSAVLSSAADLQNAQSQYQRLLKAGAKAVSQTELDNAKTALLTAQAAAEKAGANYETAKINLAYTWVKAPFDGVLGNINVAIGDFISPSMSPALVRIVQYNPARVIFSVTDKEFLQNKDLFADKVKVILSDGEAYPFTGKVIYTENALEKSTNTLAVYAEFENPQRLLIPNAYVKVLLEHTYKNVVAVAKNLVQLKDGGNFVYAVQNGTVVLLPVQIEAEKDDVFLLKNNFKADELLIVQEIEAQLAGQKVQVQNQSQKEQ